MKILTDAVSASGLARLKVEGYPNLVPMLQELLCPRCGASLPKPPSGAAVTCVYCASTFHVDDGRGAVVLACDFRDAQLPGLRLNDRMRTELRSGAANELLVHMPCADDARDEFAPLYTAAVFTDLDASVTGRFHAVEGSEVPMFAIELRTTPGISSYRLSVSPLPTFRFAAWVAGVESRVFCEWSAHPALRKDESNRVRLVARGTELRAYLNGVLVASVVDDALASGRVVLCVGPSGKQDARYSVAFSALELRDATAQP